MKDVQFKSVEQIGDSLYSFWLDILKKKIPPKTELLSLLATGDDEELCLSHLEWETEDDEFELSIGLPEKDIEGNKIMLPHGIDDAYDWESILLCAQDFAQQIGI